MLRLFPAQSLSTRPTTAGLCKQGPDSWAGLWAQLVLQSKPLPLTRRHVLQTFSQSKCTGANQPHTQYTPKPEGNLAVTCCEVTVPHSGEQGQRRLEKTVPPKANANEGETAQNPKEDGGLAPLRTSVLTFGRVSQGCPPREGFHSRSSQIDTS